MKRKLFPLIFLFILSTISICTTSCSSSAKVVVSNEANLSKYKYVIFGTDHSGDHELDDVIMQVHNEITSTKLQTISLAYAPDDYFGHTLTSSISVTSEQWEGGHTYITITFKDFLTEQSVAVIKSSGIGLSISQDQKLALKAIRKKLQSTFGKNEKD